MVAVFVEQSLCSSYGADSLKESFLLDNLYSWDTDFHIRIVADTSTASAKRQRFPPGLCDMGKLLLYFGGFPSVVEENFQC